MVTDDEIKKIKKMTKEQKMEYLEKRIDAILSEMPEEEKEAMLSAGPQVVENLLSSEGMEIMGKVVEKMFSSLSEEDIKNVQKMTEESMIGEETEDIGKMMGAGMGLIGKIMEQMMTDEGLELMRQMMGLVGDSEKVQLFMDMSQESQEKLNEIRELSVEIMSGMNPEDLSELMQRIQTVYDKHMGK
ncbi:MAG: hypothetical protein ACUVXA_19565 [Candidatus Jordarchaeum sp.]|uniref:hypothetical protein n=1 Tax=Candidatus Jordarchaeum sp. TaxID=2823881 RepID=UPI00404B7B06